MNEDLRRAQVDNQNIREIEPSLEDVFVSLTKASMAEEEVRLQALGEKLAEEHPSEFEDEERDGDA